MDTDIYKPRYWHGFSLVELSIVLVILGLLVGGVLSGKTLIRSAQIRSVGVDFNRYVAATFAFRDKYFYFPGDMPNATRFWGAANATPATCWITPSTDMKTCDGDGSGTLRSSVDNIAPNNDDMNHEIHRYWQHLANAGMIEGKFGGVGMSQIQGHNSQDGSKAGTNTPALRISNAVFQARHQEPVAGDSDNFDGTYGEVFFFGAPVMGGDGTYYNPDDPAITPAEAWNIDTKFDDGKPGTGRIVSIKKDAPAAWNTASNQCANGTSATTAGYNLVLDSVICKLIFVWKQ